jgi:hypothetical protein
MKSPANGSKDAATTFAHPSEEEFARLLEFYGVDWQYEPHSFPLAWDDDGKVVEAFTPDFYLPTQDLYVELTTLESSLMNRKHRKLRRLRELYPGVNVKLFDRRDFDELLWKYGLEGEKDALVGRSALKQNREPDSQRTT